MSMNAARLGYETSATRSQASASGSPIRTCSGRPVQITRPPRASTMLTTWSL